MGKEEERITEGQMQEFWRQVKEGHITRGYFQDFLNHGLAKDNSFLRRISEEPLIIDATSGEEILANATDVFSWIDSDFKGWGADEPGLPTGETEVAVYEMVKDGTFKQLFGSLSGDIEKLCLTQSQIKKFVKKHRNWLRTDGYGTFFLFRSKGEFFVATGTCTPAASASTWTDSGTRASGAPGFAIGWSSRNWLDLAPLLPLNFAT